MDCFASVCYFFFCKQKTAYEMRISDLSSDVCSSDLRICQQYRRVIIEQVPYPEPCQGFLMWHFNARNRSISLLTESPAQCGDVHILYPRFPEELLSPCRKIERVWPGRESEYMVDVEAYNQEIGRAHV